MKKFLLSALALVTVAALAITGTVAWLQDEDSDVNVMTTGNVYIEQIEQEWNAGETALQDFTQAKPLYPYVGNLGWENTTDNGGAYRRFTMNNVVDKYVSVKNTGKSDAYVRTIIALEMGDYNYNEFNVVGISVNSVNGAQFQFPGAWDWTDDFVAEIDGKNYNIMVAVHEEAIEPGETTIPSLLQVYLSKDATNEVVEKLDGNNNGTYDILVLSQAVQTAGFADAKTALDTAFGKSSEKAAEWFGGVLDSQDFAGGVGTKELPYLIDEPAQLMNISNYDEYTYFKVADGVDTLDMTGVGKIRLNGSFDGNGVTMNNLTTALFEYVGKSGEAQDIKISNLTANVNTTDGRGLVRNIFNPGTTTFENVALHGYIEGQYNIGSFYNYGTANSGDSEGADYTVNFVNATSDVTIVNTTGNASGGMLGHGYEGANYKLYINMDDASGYTGQMYTTGTATCYEVMAMCSHATYILNGVEVSRYSSPYPSTKLTAVAPVARADGYYVDPVDGVDHYVVSLEAQLTAYDENDVKIPNMAGLTWSMGKKTVTSGFDSKVLDLVTSAEIVNDENKPIGYEIDGGVLKAYTGRDTNYKSGWFTLNVTQYGADGKILATGNLRVFTIAEP